MIRTWMFESCFVAFCLAVVLFVTDGWSNPIEWVGSCAVLLTFCHAQVANRLAEKAAKYEALGQETVECHRWAQRYWVLKESFWLVYFLFLHAYAALVGVGVFLAYPIWRAWWRSSG